ncbi:hypothetical protein MANY_26310 [Mycolicibacterium anyangense]|uniref:HTH asnC-type domain-containing protein n=1 Tax=Mycolicibacterium anyangense TaxID=1431246 RepID=A0A6N4WB62_9MYCO|nr:hypothetical protein MANY_26310 [Mycolicibacterium anyangense]
MVRQDLAGLTPSDGYTASPPAAIDDQDTALIEELIADGKLTNRELARRTGISESAVSIRLHKLIDSGVLAFSAIIDWELAGFEWLVICRIKTRIRTPREVADDISSFPQCEAVSVVLGSFEVLGYFLVADRAELRDLTERVAAVDGLADLDVDVATDTAVPTHGRQLFFGHSTSPIRMPAPRIGLDDLDFAIVQALADDGRQSSRMMARRFGVSEGTVRARVTRLTQSGLIRVLALVEPVALGRIRVIATVSIRVDRHCLYATFKELAQSPSVAFAATCLGSWDLNVAVTARTARELMSIVSAIQSMDGVLATDTSLIVEVVRISSSMRRLDSPQ